MTQVCFHLPNTDTYFGFQTVNMKRVKASTESIANRATDLRKDCEFCTISSSDSTLDEKIQMKQAIADRIRSEESSESKAPTKREWFSCPIIITGGTQGTRQTAAIQLASRLGGRNFFKKGNRYRWTGYDGEEVVIWETSFLKKNQDAPFHLLDRFDESVEIRNHTIDHPVPFLARWIIIISPTWPFKSGNDTGMARWRTTLWVDIESMEIKLDNRIIQGTWCRPPIPSKQFDHFPRLLEYTCPGQVFTECPSSAEDLEKSTKCPLRIKHLIEGYFP